MGGGVYVAADGRPGFIRRHPWTAATLAYWESRHGAAFAGFLVGQDAVAIRLAVVADGPLGVRGDDDTEPVARFEHPVGVPHPDGNATRVAGRNRLGFADESCPQSAVPPRTPTSGHEQRRDAGVLLEFEAGTADGQWDGLERPDMQRRVEGAPCPEFVAGL